MSTPPEAATTAPANGAAPDPRQAADAHTAAAASSRLRTAWRWPKAETPAPKHRQVTEIFRRTVVSIPPAKTVSRRAAHAKPIWRTRGKGRISRGQHAHSAATTAKPNGVENRAETILSSCRELQNSLKARRLDVLLTADSAKTDAKR